MPRALDALVFGEGFDALGVDLFQLGVVVRLFRREVRGEFGPLAREPGFFIRQRGLAAGKTGLAGLRRRHTLLLFLDGAAARPRSAR